MALSDILMLLTWIGLWTIIAGVVLVAAILWYLGVRDEFVLTALAFGVGAPAGWFANRWLARPERRRKKNSIGDGNLWQTTAP